MDWDAIGAVGEILGALAVFISLVYLAVQIRNNTTQLKFDSGQAVANSGDRGFDPIYTEPSMSIWIKGHDDLDSLSAGELTIFEAPAVSEPTGLDECLPARNSTRFRHVSCFR